MKPKVFIASSSFHEKVVDSVASEIAAIATPTKWIDGKQDLGLHILEWALAKADECDFGIFVLAPDSRWGNQVNGNVLLEMGVFLSRKRQHCLILKSEDVQIPRDLDGIITANYDSAAFATDGASALAAACDAIKINLLRRRTLTDEICGVWVEEKDAGKKEGRYSLVEFSKKRGELNVRGRSYAEHGEVTLDWPKNVSYCWIPEGLDEVWHSFDSQYGRGGEYVAFGVTHFRFHPAREDGSGYFIVFGRGGIQQGLIGFQLHRIRPAYLARFGLTISELKFDDHKTCQQFIRAVAQQGAK